MTDEEVQECIEDYLKLVKEGKENQIEYLQEHIKKHYKVIIKYMEIIKKIEKKEGRKLKPIELLFYNY